MSSSVASLIDYVIKAQAHGHSIKQKPSICLYVSSVDPLTFEDICKNKLTINKTNLQSFLLSYSKIAAKSSVLLENCEVLVNYGKNNEITGCDIHSKVVTLEAGTDKANKLASLEIRLSLSPVNGLIPVLPSTRRYLRRMEKAEFFKKNNKKTSDIVSFIQPLKAQKISKKIENFSVLPIKLQPLDTNSIQILKDLLPFVNKEELLRLLIKKPLKEKTQKKAVRLMIVPTDSEDNETLEVRKKRYEKNQIQELLAQYDARQERMRE